MPTSTQAMLVLQHVDCEPPAEYEDVLIERGIGVQRVLLADGGALPDWRGFAGIIVMGGPMGAYDTSEFAWLTPELALIRDAVGAGCPLWGVCLGAQLLACALGARVWPGPQPEVGICQVSPTPQARHDPVFGGVTGPVPVLQWHADSFDLPAGAVLLASSPQYPHQARRGRGERGERQRACDPARHGASLATSGNPLAARLTPPQHIRRFQCRLPLRPCWCSSTWTVSHRPNTRTC